MNPSIVPLGLNPQIISALGGTAEAMPLPKSFQDGCSLLLLLPYIKYKTY
jgi:hypothetical protein